MSEASCASKPDVESLAAYVVEKTKYVIEAFGVRDPGSEGEFKAQQYVQRELEDYADEVRMEPFQVTPKALMSFLPITGVLMLVSIFVYRAFPGIALALCGLGVLIVLLDFWMYKKVLDPFFPKRTSHNVYAVRRASGERKRRIILNGHVDAAYEMRYNLMGRGPLTSVVLGCIVGMVFLLLLHGAHVFLGPFLEVRLGLAWRVIEFARFVFVPAYVAALFFTRFSVVSPGANDNLTGVFTAIGILKHLHENGIRFEHTEVACLITGSEEAGLRGAKAFVGLHGASLKKEGTVFLALDTFRDTESLAIYSRDLNGTVRHDPRFCRLLQQAGRNCGLDLGFRSIYLGASDAVPFTQAGIPAVALVGMDPTPPRYYHTRLDDWPITEPECIRRAFTVVAEALHLYDQRGM